MRAPPRNRFIVRCIAAASRRTSSPSGRLDTRRMRRIVARHIFERHWNAVASLGRLGGGGVCEDNGRADGTDCDAPFRVTAQTMIVTRSGARPAQDGPAASFTGAVRVTSL